MKIIIEQCPENFKIDHNDGLPSTPIINVNLVNDQNEIIEFYFFSIRGLNIAEEQLLEIFLGFTKYIENRY